MKPIVTHEQLWQVDQEVRDRFPMNDKWFLFAEGLETVGLLVGPPPLQYEEPRSHCTPVNSLTFAGTFCDGVHFGYLIFPDVDPAQCPVVRNCPGYSGDDGNTIVGENLYEFLCLGCRSGYDLIPRFADESLYEMTLADFHADPNAPEWAIPLAEHRRSVLDYLTERLHLQPWPNVERRLAELKEKYSALIQLPEAPRNSK